MRAGLLLKIGLAALSIVVWLTLPASAEPFEDAQMAFCRGDYATALRLWRPLAEDGNALAQYNLGILYSNGFGTARDDAEAAQWYRKAAEQGEARAQSALGYMLAEGRGVTQDYDEAISWYQLAANQGLVDAQYNLGILYDDDEGVADHLLASFMWSSLAAARLPSGSFRDMAMTNRDLVAVKMTPAQVNLVVELAQEWRPK